MNVTWLYLTKNYVIQTFNDFWYSLTDIFVISNILFISHFLLHRNFEVIITTIIAISQSLANNPYKKYL